MKNVKRQKILSIYFPEGPRDRAQIQAALLHAPYVASISWH
ncbi:MAG TPA: hypothetical protein VH186_02625 [Chloroflexia bacterium]|nr:hypothetical protein [Chloroflexia bacterium]